MAYIKEKQNLKAMMSATISYCDINITKNKVERIDGIWAETTKQVCSCLNDDCYSEFIQCVGEKLVLPSHKDLYNEMLSRDNLAKLFEANKTTFCFEIKRYAPTGVPIWVLVTVHMMRDETSEDLRGFIYLKNIDSEKKELAGLMFLSQRDPLTGVYNRIEGERLTDDFLHECCDKDSRHAFFFLDLDHFKSINDIHGHMHGDDILKDVAECIKSQLRVSDIPIRLGGDEFAALIKDIRDIQHIKTKAQNMIEAIVKAGDKYNPKIDSSVSIGIAVAPLDGTDFATLYQKADQALYQVKHDGKRGYSFFNPQYSIK